MSDTVVWICAGTNVALSGSNNTFIMSGSGSVGLSGSDNTAYIKSGCLWYVTGNGNTIYEGFGADAQVSMGSTSTVIACPAMTIDQSSAPSPGCSGVGIEEQAMERSWSATFDGAAMNIIQPDGSATFRITDVLGHQVLSGVLRAGSNRIDLNTLPAGAYMLLGPSGRLVMRFTKA